MDDRTATRRTERVRWGDSGPFGICPAWIMDADVSDRAVRLYVVLARLAGSPEAATFRGHAELQDRLRCGRTAVKAAIKELVDIGALTVEERTYDNGGRKANSYVVHAAQGVAGATPHSRAGDGGGSRGGDGPRARGDKTPIEREEVNPTGSLPAAAATATPKLVKVAGRNLGMDALAEVCGIDDRSPRYREVVTAINGARGRPGIRALYWGELDDGQRRAFSSWRAVSSFGDPEDTWASSFESAVADAVRRKASLYRSKMGGAMLTPTALAKWWIDLEAMATVGGRRGMTPEAVAALRSDEL